MKKRFYIYTAWQRPMERLTDEQLGKFLRLYYQMQLTGDLEVESGDPMVDMFLDQVREQVAYDTKAYDEKCAANAENGKKGGRPKNPDGFSQNRKNPDGFSENPKKAELELDSELDTDSELEPDKEAPKGAKREKTPSVSKREAQPRFRPPTVEEVEAYCFERNNRVDPERFVDFYSSNGWKVGKNPMKDWKAAVRTWEKRDGPDNVVGLNSAQRMEAARNEVLDRIIGGVM